MVIPAVSGGSWWPRLGRGGGEVEDSERRLWGQQYSNIHKVHNIIVNTNNLFKHQISTCIEYRKFQTTTVILFSAWDSEV